MLCDRSFHRFLRGLSSHVVPRLWSFTLKILRSECHFHLARDKIYQAEGLSQSGSTWRILILSDVDVVIDVMAINCRMDCEPGI